MSDLIDRQALLDECLNHYEVGNIEQNCTMDWICKTVRNFPAASPWHRVESKEDLPKDSNTYIVYLRQGTKVETPEWMGGEPLSYVTEMAFDREQMLWRADDDAYNAILSFVDTERDFHVTHWMEKPEPPKEDA